MPAQKEFITTQADLLLNLLRQKGEISIEAAAKELNMPVQTVESYANFFEEEGLININYKFTTPFISLKASQVKIPEIDFSVDDTKLKEQRFAQLKRKVGDELQLLRLKLKSGEYYLLKEKYPEILRQLKELIRSNPKGLSLDKANTLNTHILQLSTKIEEANKKLEEERVEDARQDFVFLEKELDRVYHELERGHSQAQEIPLPSIKRPHELTDYFADIKAAMRTGDFERANLLMAQLKDSFQRLPEEESRREEELKKDIERLEGEMQSAMLAHLSKEMQQKSAQIRTLLAKSKGALEKGQLTESIRLFNSIKPVFESLPQGFLKEKVELSNEIEVVHTRIEKVRTQVLEHRFDEIARQIKLKLEQISDDIDAKRFDRAIQGYNDATALFSALPELRAPVRNNLKNYLLLIYERLSEIKQQYYELHLKKITESINWEINKAYKAIKQKDFRTAKEKYSACINAFRSIPKRYSNVVIPLEERLEKLYEDFSRALEQESWEELGRRTAQITSILSKIESLIQNGRYEEGMAHFQRAMVLFNRLPSGFAQQKAHLESLLTGTEKRLMEGIELTLLKKASPQTKEDYKELVKYIALFQMHIESNALNLASVDHRRITAILDRMPYGVFNSSKVIAKELKEISKAMQAIGLLKSLGHALQLGNVSEVKKLHTQVMAVLARFEPGHPYLTGLQTYLHNILTNRGTLARLPKRISHPLTSWMGEPIIESPRVTKEELLRKLEEGTSFRPAKGGLPQLQPASPNELEALKRLASRQTAGKKPSEEFERLKKVLEKDILATIASRKRELVVANKLKMARMLIEFGKPQRARELLREILKLDPGNRTAKMLEGLAGGKLETKAA